MEVASKRAVSLIIFLPWSGIAFACTLINELNKTYRWREKQNHEGTTDEECYPVVIVPHFI